MNILNSVEKYDPHTGHWTNVTPMATKRSGKMVGSQDRPPSVGQGRSSSLLQLQWSRSQLTLLLASDLVP